MLPAKLLCPLIEASPFAQLPPEPRDIIEPSRACVVFAGAARQAALPANPENNYHSSVQPQNNRPREETDDGCRIYNQWQGGERRDRTRHGAALGRARAPQTHRHEVRVRFGSLRRLHGAYRRHGRPILPDADVERRRQESHDDRGALAELEPSVAESLDRRAGAAVRLLPVGP